MAFNCSVQISNTIFLDTYRAHPNCSVRQWTTSTQYLAKYGLRDMPANFVASEAIYRSGSLVIITHYKSYIIYAQINQVSPNINKIMLHEPDSFVSAASSWERSVTVAICGERLPTPALIVTQSPLLCHA